MLEISVEHWSAWSWLKRQRSGRQHRFRSIRHVAALSICPVELSSARHVVSQRDTLRVYKFSPYREAMYAAMGRH